MMWKARVAALVLAGAACSTKARAPDWAIPRPAAAAPTPTTEAEAPSTPPWHRQSKPSELLCSDGPEMTGPYAASLSAGRKAAAAKRWGAAIDAFRQALVERPDDPAALGELSWALLSAGDAPRALEAGEKASQKSTEPKQKAAALYNAARAAEALGDLARARSLLQASLDLRPNDTVQQRLANLAAPTVRAAPLAAPSKGCQGLPSAAAVCDCLLDAAATSDETGSRCEPTKPQGARGHVVALETDIPDSDDYDPARRLVLVAKVGAAWSAIQLVDQADSVDHAEMPLATEGAEVTAYEELPYRGGTLHWVQTVSEFSETMMGETLERGHAALTLCWIRDAAQPVCARFSLAEWDYSYTGEAEDGDHCRVQSLVHYHVDVASDGELHMVLEAGRDLQALSGRYRLPFR